MINLKNGDIKGYYCGTNIIANCLWIQSHKIDKKNNIANYFRKGATFLVVLRAIPTSRFMTLPIVFLIGRLLVRLESTCLI